MWSCRHGIGWVYRLLIYLQKQNLTIEEAAVYSNIGQHKLRELTADERCPFVLWVGNKRLIKRRQFDEYMSRAYSI